MESRDQGSLLADAYSPWLRRLAPNLPAALQEAIRRLFTAIQEGHVCIRVEVADAAEWLSTEWVGQPGDYKPFVLEDSRFYLARYWDHERVVAGALRQRASADCVQGDVATLQQGLSLLFSGEPGDRQRLAAIVAQLKPLTLISGGPGTGKTTTVVKLLALLLMQQPGLRIGLAAPTGKAAQRLAEAIRAAKGGLPVAQQVLDAIPEVANTLHRLLGAQGDTGRFRHGPENPLALDALVIDEASMIDLAMMRATLDAVSPSTRLILLGDRNQLASVEAGSVFGDICAFEGFSAAFLQQLEIFGVDEPSRPDVPALGDCRVELTRSYRFDAASGIGALARASRDGDSEAFAQAFSATHNDIVWEQDGKEPALRVRIQAGYAAYVQTLHTGDVAAAFAAFQRFRVLCAHRKGPAGVEGLNRLAETALGVPAAHTWYEGRPVLISANDYALRLFNGDVGLCLRTPEGLRVFFESGVGQYRSLLPGRVPAHETAYAMTVHKSQGSEFEDVLLVLPEQLTPVLNRPLVYTAITRAKKRFALWGSPAVLQGALASLPQRESGLQVKLAE